MAHWIYLNRPYWYPQYMCSNCSWVQHNSNEVCNNCGADMTGEVTTKTIKVKHIKDSTELSGGHLW